LLQDDHPGIRHGNDRKIERRVSIPGDDRSQDLGYDHSGVRANG
jgi:hypothetical protein